MSERELSAADVRSRALSGIATMGLRSLLVRVLGLLGNVVLARLLAPEEFGYIAFGYALLVVGGFLSTGGLASSLVNRAAPPERRELQAVVSLQLAFTLAATGIVALVGVAGAGKAAYVAAIMMASMPLCPTAE